MQPTVAGVRGVWGSDQPSRPLRKGVEGEKGLGIWGIPVGIRPSPLTSPFLTSIIHTPVPPRAPPPTRQPEDANACLTCI